MAVAEVTVAGLVGVGGPVAAALVAEVVVDLLLGDDDDFFLAGGANQQALVDEGREGRSFVAIRGGDLGRELL